MTLRIMLILLWDRTTVFHGSLLTGCIHVQCLSHWALFYLLVKHTSCAPQAEGTSKTLWRLMVIAVRAWFHATYLSIFIYLYMNVKPIRVCVKKANKQCFMMSLYIYLSLYVYTHTAGEREWGLLYPFSRFVKNILIFEKNDVILFIYGLNFPFKMLF